MKTFLMFTRKLPPNLMFMIMERAPLPIQTPATILPLEKLICKERSRLMPAESLLEATSTQMPKETKSTLFMKLDPASALLSRTRRILTPLFLKQPMTEQLPLQQQEKQKPLPSRLYPPPPTLLPLPMLHLLHTDPP